MKWASVPVVALLAIGSYCAAECKNVRPYEAVLGIDSSPVLIVSDVQSGSVAARAGLKAGDIILASNGRRIRERATFQEFQGRIREQALWQSADLTVLSATEGQGAVKRHVLLRLNTPDDRFGFVSGVGFYVERVRSAGMGDRLGIRAGDFISKVSEQASGTMKGRGDMDLALDQAIAHGRFVLEVSRLTSAQGGTTQWTTQNLTWLGDPIDGPVPPPRKPEIIRN